MRKKTDDLSPRQRIEAVLSVHQSESPGTPISIVAVCQLASVSRASLYEHHRDLIDRIQKLAKAKKKRVGNKIATTATVSDLKRKLADEKKRTNVLYYLCIELQAEVRRLEIRIALNSNKNDEVLGRRLKNIKL